LAERVDLTELLAAQLADPATGWSVGTFGAIAEFTRDRDEPVHIERVNGGFSAVTERGAISLRAVPELRLVASESATRQSWTQRVALCLPQDRCAMNGRSVLTELGPDTQAIRPADRDAILFDLGLDLLQVDACIRVADPELAEKLRACCGRKAFDPDSPAMGMIVAAGPNRVFISRLGRAEVFQGIPPPHGKSPEGPHTHVLPRLLAHRRTHAATEAIPDGLVPCAHFYPAHPLTDGGAYEARAHRVFQELMQTFGDAELVALKRRLAAAVSSGADPSRLDVPDDRFARIAVRVGLRQLAAANGSSAALAAWQQAHDRPNRSDTEIEDIGVPGH
jgi:hypothetical protein